MIKLTPELLSEVLTGQDFYNEVKTALTQIKDRRDNRPSPEPGTQYRRDVIDAMGDDVNPRFFVKSYFQILNKQSPLPRSQRTIIDAICTTALSATITKLQT